MTRKSSLPPLRAKEILVADNFDTVKITDSTDELKALYCRLKRVLS